MLLGMDASLGIITKANIPPTHTSLVKLERGKFTCLWCGLKPLRSQAEEGQVLLSILTLSLTSNKNDDDYKWTRERGEAMKYESHPGDLKLWGSRGIGEGAILICFSLPRAARPHTRKIYKDYLSIFF